MRFTNRDQVELKSEIFNIDLTKQNKRIAEYFGLEKEVRRKRRPPIDYKILGQFKPHLYALFEHKCAYCESHVEDIKRGDIEHFRPKMNAKDSEGTTSLEHYSWLAYDWDNLYLACKVCNHAKRNSFPVEEGRSKIDSNLTVRELRSKEKAYLIDPCYNLGSQHLIYDMNGRVRAREGRARGLVHIQTLDLNRSSLVTARRNAYQAVMSVILAKQWEFLEVIKTGANIYSRISKSENRLTEQETFIFGAKFRHSGAVTKMLLEDAYQQTRFMGNLKEYLTRVRGGEIPLPSELPAKEYSSVSATQIGKQKEPDISADYALKNITKEQPLTEVSISNFKAIEHIEFKLGVTKDSSDSAPSAPCMIILGENATGKSSILEAVTLGLLGSTGINELNRILKEKIVLANCVHRPNGKTDIDRNVIEMKVGLGFGIEKTMTSESETPDSVISGMAGDEMFFGENRQSKVVLAYGARRYFLSSKVRRPRAEIHRVTTLFDPMATITNPAPWLKSLNSTKFEAVVRALKPILMLREDEQSDDDIYFKDDDIYVFSSGVETQFDDMSVGYKSVISMVVDIMRELLDHYDNLEDASAIVLIDEIETHLHPRWKMQIMTALRTSMPQVQFIVTTHDPLCLRGMKDGEIFVMRRDFDQETGRYSGNPQIHSLTIRPGMDADDILTSAGFGLPTTFIDDKTEEALSAYSRLLLEVDKNRLSGVTTSVDTERELIEARSKLSTTFSGFGATALAEEEYFRNTKNVDPSEDSTLSKFERVMKQVLDQKQQ